MKKWEDYYELLGIGRYATDEQIKKSYQIKARIFHPDHSTGNKFMMQLLNEAYEVLSTPEKKESYDREWDIKNGQVVSNRNETGLIRMDSSSLALSFQDHYKALNINRDTATTETIRQAYLQVLKSYQEGVFGQNSEMGIRIVGFAEAAYNVLINPETKANYDKLWDKHNGRNTVAKQSNQSVVVSENKVSSDLTKHTDKETSMTEFFENDKLLMRRGLIAFINYVLLNPEKLNFQKSENSNEGPFVGIRNCIGLFYDDFTFQFVKEESFFEDSRLVSLNTGTLLTDWIWEDKKRFWRNFGNSFMLNLQNVIAFPIDRIIPTGMIKFDRKGTPVISRKDLIFVENVIRQLLVMYPELLEVYFRDYIVPNSGKKM